jgi:hypothetical protein
MKTEEILIVDNENKIRWFPTFIRKRFLKKYHHQGLVQFDSDTDELCICGDTVKWLDKLCVETTSEERADQLMFDFLNKKYPQYKPYIQLF